VCSDCSESWLCLNCHATNCSRYLHGHQVAHHSTTGHALALSHSDLSAWCFDCDKYVDDNKLSAAKLFAHKAKFGTGVSAKHCAKHCAKYCTPLAPEVAPPGLAVTPRPRLEELLATEVWQAASGLPGTRSGRCSAVPALAAGPLHCTGTDLRVSSTH
jgi:hypothetical protein